MSDEQATETCEILCEMCRCAVESETGDRWGGVSIEGENSIL